MSASSYPVVELFGPFPLHGGGVGGGGVANERGVLGKLSSGASGCLIS